MKTRRQLEYAALTGLAIASAYLAGCNGGPKITAYGSTLCINPGNAAIRSFSISPADNSGTSIYAVQGSFDYVKHTFPLHAGANGISVFEVAHGSFQVNAPSAGATTVSLPAGAQYIAQLCTSKCVQTQFTVLSKTEGAAYPARPTVPPPPFKLFHQTDNSLTLVTADNATDEQIESILWQLHDAARDKSFDKLHLPQTFIDKRDPIVFIHIYRGSKCAAEKYAAGEPPCGGSYHAAGDYTLGSFTNPKRDDGFLLHDENHETELWSPDQAVSH